MYRFEVNKVIGGQISIVVTSMGHWPNHTYTVQVYVRSVTVKSSNLPFWVGCRSKEVMACLKATLTLRLLQEDGNAGSARKLLSGAVAVKLLQYPLLTLLPATLTGKQVCCFPGSFATLCRRYLGTVSSGCCKVRTCQVA